MKESFLQNIEKNAIIYISKKQINIIIQNYLN